MWAFIAALAKTIIEIKSIANKLTALSKGGLAGLISSYFIDKAVGAMAKVGIPLDQVYYLPSDFQQYLHSEFVLHAGDYLKELSKVLEKIDPAAIVDKAGDYIKSLFEGYAVANGPSPAQNKSRGADPIIFLTGEFEREVTDFTVNGAGIDFEFRRTYRSSAAYLGPLGPCWDHNYNLRLREENEHVVVILTGQLSEQHFVKHPRFGEADDFSYFVPPNGVHDFIVPHGDSFLLRKPKGVTYCYQSTTQPGKHRISEIKDRFGNYLEFHYDNDDRLRKVLVNSAYRYVTIDEYDEFNRIVCIKDHFGRYVVYKYDEWNFLECVAGPAYRDEEPASAERYEYESVGRVRKLARVIDWKGRIVVENEYERNELSEHFGKVIRQRVNKGEYTFFYESIIDETDPSTPDRDRPALRVWEYRRNGHQVEHVVNVCGNELLTRERLIEGGRIRQVVNHYRYNADGELIARIDPNGVLTQYLFGRDHLADSMLWPDIDPVIADIPLKDRLNFGNLLAEVTRGKKVAESGASVDQSFWERLPNVKIRDDVEDNIMKYTYERDSNLLLSQSDPLYTEAADPLYAESSAYQRHLTRYQYRPGPRFELWKTIFPNLSRPSSLDGLSFVTNIVEEIEYEPNKGRPIEKTDSRGYQWFYEYYPLSTDPALRSKEGFLRRRIIPHIDWVLNKDTPDILEIKRDGGWQALDHYLISSGIVYDSLNILVEGVRIVLYQSSELLDNIVSDNSQVLISVDGIVQTPWDQTKDSEYLINDLPLGLHEVEVRDVIGIPVAIGRIRTHVSIEYAVDDLGLVSREIDARGNVNENSFNARGQKTKSLKGSPNNPFIMHNGYDAAGRLVFEKEEWRDEEGDEQPQVAVVRCYQYDQKGLLLSESVGPEKEGIKRFTRHLYDCEDNRPETINPRGVRTFFGYDELNRHIRTVRAGCSPDCTVTLKTYDLAGHLLSVRNPRGALRYNGYLTAGRKWKSSIDNLGRIRIQTDPLGHLLVTDYDNLDNPTIVRQFQRRSDNQYEMLSRRATEYDEHGNVIIITDAIFDSPILTANPINTEHSDEEFLAAVNAGNVKNAVTENHLDAQGNTEAVRNPDGGIQRKRFDGQGRIYDELDPEGRRTFRIYDGNGNIIRTYTFDPVRNQAPDILNYEIFLQLIEYNELNRLIKRTDSYGNQWVQRYDTLGNLTCTIDPLGNVVRFKYNAFGEEITRVQELTKTGLGGDPVSIRLITKKVYDANGNVLTIIDPAGRRTEFQYDSLDRLVELWFAVNPNEPHEYRSYDPAGNLISLTDRNGLIKKMTYDLLNHHIRTDIDTSNVSQDNMLSALSSTFASFQYDAAGNLTQHMNNYCTVDILRDSRGLPISEKVNIQNIPDAPGAKEFIRNFDIAGNREKIIYPSGREVSYLHDHMGRIILIRNISSPDYPGRDINAPGFDLAHFSYSGNRLALVEYGNGLILTLRYEGRGHVLDQTVSRTDGTIIWHLQRLRDAAGNTRIESSSTRAGSRSRKFFLDSIYRLTNYQDKNVNWSNPNDFEPPQVPINPLNLNNQNLIDNEIGPLEMPVTPPVYEYDEMGNRLYTREPRLDPFESDPNELNQYSKVDANAWVYDSNGNLREDDSRKFLYDLNNLLQEIWEKNNNVREVLYYRDALDRVIAEKSANSIFRIYNNYIPLVEILNNNRREFVAGHLSDMIIHAALNNEDYWITYDGLKSIRLLTDNTGTAVSIPSFRPFGESEDGELDLSPLQFGFAGMWFTHGLPFYNPRYRTYRPDIGRYFQRDPAGSVDNLNLYTYARNNPIRYRDPTGLQSLDVDITLKLDPELYEQMVCIEIEEAVEKGLSFSDIWSSVGSVIDETIGFIVVYNQAFETKIINEWTIGGRTLPYWGPKIKEISFNWGQLAKPGMLAITSTMFAGINILGSYYQQDPETRALGLSLEGIGAFGGLGTTFAAPILLGTGGALPVLGAGLSGVSIGLFLNNYYNIDQEMNQSFENETLRLQIEAALDTKRLGLPLSSHSKRLLEELEKRKQVRKKEAPEKERAAREALMLKWRQFQ